MCVRVRACVCVPFTPLLSGRAQPVEGDTPLSRGERAALKFKGAILPLSREQSERPNWPCPAVALRHRAREHSEGGRGRGRSNGRQCDVLDEAAAEAEWWAGDGARVPVTLLP